MTLLSPKPTDFPYSVETVPLRVLLLFSPILGLLIASPTEIYSPPDVGGKIVLPFVVYVYVLPNFQTSPFYSSNLPY